ncbi:MAG: PIN domain-containing protein [Deltaproteobacteria bacterium]|nr:PIN domain-containing protein [Deltaproteobacteria bacterium]
MVMIDSSVWIDVLRDGTGARAATLRRVIDGREVVLARLTQFELLQGARDEAEWDLLTGALDAQDYLEPGPETWKQAARLWFELRRRGVTIRSSIDCCIAQVALEHEIPLLHRDQDFVRIAGFRPLQQVFVEWS